MVPIFTLKIARLVDSCPYFSRVAVASALGGSLRVSAVALGIVLGLSPMVAQAQPGESVQPEENVQNTNNRGGGSRGCSRLLGESGLSDWPAEPVLVSQNTPLTQVSQGQVMPAVLLLVNDRGLIQTRSTRPSFAWYVRDAATVPLEFRIYRQPTPEEIEAGQFLPGDADLVFELNDPDLVSRPGLMTFVLPDSTPPLQSGQRYWWQVEMQCDPTNTSSNTFAEADLEVSPDSAQPLWYDPLDQLLKLESSSEKADPIHGHFLSDQVSEDLANLLQTEMGLSFQTAIELKNSEFYPISLQRWSETKFE